MSVDFLQFSSVLIFCLAWRYDLSVCWMFSAKYGVGRIESKALYSDLFY